MKPVKSQLEYVVAELFDRLPALVGFSVEQLDRDGAAPRHVQLEDELMLANVETFPGTGDARELLRGRTFARRLH